MKAITYAIVILTLLGLTQQQCGGGCTKCANNNVCLACDTSRQAVLRQTNVCQVTNLQNCAVVSQNNNCIQCAAGYYFDPNQQLCSAVAAPNVITNCAVYATASTCQICVDGAVMIAGQCRLVPNPIPYCRTYNTDSTCLKCNVNYVVASNLTACVPLNIPNCQAGSFIKCRTCASGFVYANLTSFSSLFQYNTATSIANNINSFVSGPWAPQTFCLPTYNYTCIDFTSPNCIPVSQVPANPQNNQAVPNCGVYIAGTPNPTCSACIQGFKFNGQTPPACVAVGPLTANCVAYRNNDAIGACIACANGMFINGANCVARINNNIPGCQTYTANADSCATCSPSLVISTDGLACFPPLPYCQTYLALTAFYPINNCQLCINGFFNNATKNATNCTNGTVPNCTVYNAYDNSCAVCQPGTYLANGNCLAHQQIPGCILYDVTNGIKCKTCNGTQVPFTVLNKCIPTTPKAGCVDYASDGITCVACNPGNYIVAGSCVAIPATLTNCIAYSGTACTGCSPGFMLNLATTPVSCLPPLDYVVGNSSNCAYNATNTNPTWTSTGQLLCTACRETTAPYVPNFNEAICVNNNQLALTSGYAAVANCARYGKSLATGNPVVCMECARGYYLSGYQALGPFTLATTCQQTCASSTVATTTAGTTTAATTVYNSIIIDDLYGFVTICVPVLGTGYVQVSAYCAKYVRSNVAVTSSTSTTYISDFTCLSVTPSATTATYPASFLLYDAAANVGVASHTYEKLIYNNVVANAGTYAVNAPWDFSNGFANTVDATASLYPTVFNYRGLLTANAYNNIAMIRLNMATDAIAAANVKLNTFTNCDIITNTPTANVGFAFAPTLSTYTPLYAPVTIGTTYYHCYRCAFGYGLAYTAGSTAALTSPFPSCAAITQCTTSQVYGGLPRYLNSLLSCHVCTSTGTGTTAVANFPTLYVEVDAVPNAGSTTGIVMGFQPDQAFTLTGTTISVNPKSGFKCAAAPTALATGNVVTVTAFAGCAVFANIRSIATYATTAALPTIASSAITAANNNVCLACSPGFYPTYLDTTVGNEQTSITTNSLPGWVVTACTASQYCDPTATTGMFNGCPRCDPRITPSAGGSAAFNDFTFANCVLTSALNCLMAEGVLDASTTNPCTVCKSGFYLTSDNNCDMIAVPNQASGASFAPSAYLKAFNPTTLAATPAAVPAIRNLRVFYLQTLGSLNYGVNNCTTGYTRFPIHSNVYSVCASSNFLGLTRMRANSSPTNPNFIANCAKYAAMTTTPANPTAPIRCYECLAPFLVSQDGSVCVLFPVPSLCQIAVAPVAGTTPAALPANMPGPTPNNSPLCFQCLPGTLFVSGVCLNPSIPGCLTYTQTTTTGTLPIACAVCSNTLAPSTGGISCNPGPVDNCLTYTDSVTCSSCLQGFQLLPNLRGRPYCLPMPNQLNCTAIDPTQAINYNFQCTHCRNSNTTSFAIQAYITPTVVTGNTADVCLNITTIANCPMMTIAARNPAVNNNPNFFCGNCAPGFFWNPTILWCQTRSVWPAQCATFNPNADTCATCAPNFFLSTDSTTCSAFPTAMANCFSVSPTNVCTQCNTGFFLNGGYCIGVTKLVRNCIFYLADGVCSQCGLGQVAINNGTTCTFPVVTNCTSWLTPSSCASCPPTTYLASVTTYFNNLTGLNVTAAGPNVVTILTNSCQTLPIGNCSIGFANGTCVQCLPNFYWSTAKTCLPVTTIIPNCVTYVNATACQSCAVGSVVSWDSSRCIPNLYNNLADANCADSFVDVKPNCVVCNPGFYLDRNGACSPCTTPVGCAYCNPNVPDQCLLCSPGFDMNAAFTCTSSTVTNVAIPNWA